jgi:hypothetical protein
MTNQEVKNAFHRHVSARSSNGNLSTDGQTLYSYSTPIAAHVENGLTLITPYSYSMTTASKHKPGIMADHVLPDLVTLYSLENYRWCVKSGESHRGKAKRARLPENRDWNERMAHYYESLAKDIEPRIIMEAIGQTG